MTNNGIRFINLTNLNLTIFSSKTDAVGVKYPSEGLRAVDTLFGKGEQVQAGDSIIACGADYGNDPSQYVSVQRIADDGKTVLETVSLPEPQQGTLLIVPIPVQNMLWTAGRRDVIGIGNTRQQDGKPVGAEGFVYKGSATDLRALLSGAAQ